MHARSFASPVLVCLALACGPGDASSTKTADAAKAPAEAPAEAPPEAPVEAPAEALAEAPVEAPAEAPVEAPAEPPLPPPTKAEALAASRAALSTRLAELAPIVALGPRRHAIALRVRVDDDPGAADLVVAIMQGSERESDPSAATWTVTTSTVVQRIPGTGESEEPPALPTTLLAEDFDDDGELELELRYREDVMCGGGGVNTITKLALLDVDPELALAMTTQLHHTMGANPVETKAKLEHEDVDGDGHRDVRIGYVTIDGETKTEAQNVWLWSASSDRWELRPAATTDALPTYDRWDCDW